MKMLNVVAVMAALALPGAAWAQGSGSVGTGTTGGGSSGSSASENPSAPSTNNPAATDPRSGTTGSVTRPMSQQACRERWDDMSTSRRSGLTIDRFMADCTAGRL